MLQKRWVAIEQELNARHLERRDVIRSLLLGLLSRSHVMLLGAPGADKTGLSQDLCRRITQAVYFEWQLSRHTKPDHLFGPMSLKALEQDRYLRKTTGKLPEAHIAYLDETWKGAEGCLNELLAALNERVFHNDGPPTPIPLEMAVGASNELPEDRQTLGALWDRFLLRHVVHYLQDPTNFSAMLTHPGPTAVTTITLEELKQSQAAVAQVAIDAIVPLIFDLRLKLVQEHHLHVSDRRWKQSMGVLRAQAWLEGRTVVEAQDVLVLQHVLWEHPDQHSTVARVLRQAVSPFDQDAYDVWEHIQAEMAEVFAKPAGTERIQAGAQFIPSIDAAEKQVQQLRHQADLQGVSLAALDPILAQLTAAREEVMHKCFNQEKAS